ncbi:hypothetical protein ABBQ38_005854 [Trebouxia sp. C0009 RCD-2024]
MRRQALHIADVTKTTYNRDVYEPSDDSFALVDALQQELVKIPLSSACQCLEIGSGSGYVSCSLALLLRHCNVSASCIATDISVHAVTATKATVAAHQVTEVDVIQADLVSPLSARLQQAVDILVTLIHWYGMWFVTSVRPMIAQLDCGATLQQHGLKTRQPAFATS